MKKVRYKIEVPYGCKRKIASKLGITDEYVSRALRYDSETAPSQINIRNLAINEFGGRIVKTVYK